MLVINRVFDVKVVTSSLFYFYCGAVTVLFCVVAYFYLLTLPISKECLKFGVTISPSDTAVSVSVSEHTPILNAQGNAYDSSQDLMIGKTNAVHNPYISAIEMGNVSSRQHKGAVGESKRSGAPSMDLGTTHSDTLHTHTHIHIHTYIGVVASPMSSARALKLSRYMQSRTLLEADTPTTTTTTATSEPLDKWQLLQKIWTQEILVNQR